ncbi:porin [Thalassotalea aquiviva]|uniref:porin n=1 Tax=Thalassotalea aquiviva TaxID=3242415 RepID=UPI00352A9E87
MKRTLLATALIGLFAQAGAYAADDAKTIAELKATIEKQNDILEQLERRINETEQAVNATVEVVEDNMNNSMPVSIGGYGELHYNNLSDANGSDKKEIDFHRFVLFFNTEFNSTTRFFSEFELEHSLAGEGKNGEVELEQAYIEHDVNDALTAKAGLFLVPVGLLNETHEPPTFYGVERNPVEKNILPTTWWEAGVGFNYEIAPGLAVDAALHSGLDISKKGSYKPRDGRQKVSEAAANDLAMTTRIKYTGIPGLELAGSLQYQGDITQGGELGDGTQVDEAAATLFTAHAVYQQQNFGLKALYAMWNIDGAEAEELGRDKQLGYYIEPSWRFNNEFGVFARYTYWDNNDGNSDETDVAQTNVGFNYYLHEDVVFKADYEKQTGAKDIDGFNLGVGYRF